MSNAKKPLQYTRQRTLNALYQQSAQVLAWDNIFKELLTPDMRPYCRVANLRAGCLLIEADSSAWATRLRYGFPQLLPALKAQLPQIQSLRCYVYPHSKPLQAKNLKQKLSLSQADAELISQTAGALSNGPLKQALYRLAANAKVGKK